MYYYYSLFVNAQPSMVFWVHGASEVTNTQQLVYLGNGLFQVFMVRGWVIGKVICVPWWVPTAMTTAAFLLQRSAPAHCHLPVCLVETKLLFPQWGTGETVPHDFWRPSSPLFPSTSKKLPVPESVVCCLSSELPSPNCSLFHFDSCL